MSKIEKVVEKEKIDEEQKEISPSDDLLEYFKNADQILSTDFEKRKKKKTMPNLKILKKI